MLTREKRFLESVLPAVTGHNRGCRGFSVFRSPVTPHSTTGRVDNAPTAPLTACVWDTSTRAQECGSTFASPFRFEIFGLVRQTRP